MTTTLTPRELGFHFPAEFEPHESTWLSWPHKEASWPGKIDTIYPVYSQFVSRVAEGERVNVNVNDLAMQIKAIRHLEEAGADLSRITFHFHPTNDAWCRDHGPAFLVNRKENKKMIVDWGYNAWGNKYPPYDLDDVIPTLIARHLKLPVAYPGIVMEGGSVEFNGRGTLMTSESCLLNPNRNPNLNQDQIEELLSAYYGASHILWLGDGIVGDDTDGHIDDLTRFVDEDTVVTMIEHNRSDENFAPLRDNVRALEAMKLENGRSIRIMEVPMPAARYYEGQRLPMSYANFYIANRCVIVPVFGDRNDDKALDVLQSCFPDRTVVGLDSSDLIWGLGSFHCLSQQEPAL